MTLGITATGTTTNRVDGADGQPTVTDNTPLSYQWYFNNAPIAGQTAPTLTLQNVTTANQGTYTASATDVGGSATCFPILLTVSQ